MENENIFASYGILREPGNNKKKELKFIYLDHGYFNASSRKFTKEKNNIK